MPHSSPDVNEISERYLADHAAAHPVEATFLGVTGHETQLSDYSPEGCEHRADLARAAVEAVAATEPADDAGRVAKAVFLERIGLEVEKADAGVHVGVLNTIASPVQDIRSVFDLMATDTEDDWAVVAKRLAAVPDSVAGLIASYDHVVAQGRPPVSRQVDKVAEQCERWSGATGDESFFAALAGRAEVSDALRRDLDTAAAAATAAYGDLARHLRTVIAPAANPRDAVGEDAYRLHSRDFLGAAIDLDEAYRWGWDEFARLESEMVRVAERIAPGKTLAEVAEGLDHDERYQVRGRAEFTAWMQGLSDRAMADLRGTHFDLSDRVMKLECLIAPPGGGVGAYYTPPNEDFTRPGRMWWSVAADREVFTTWREVTTVYHEGAPGHHLQCAMALDAGASLNKFQRMMCWVSGHGEGWALYAERLMNDLGYLSDDGDLLGMLDGQLFRAARVIVDIGMHLELPIPAGTGFHEGERWTPELGLEFMLTRTITAADHVRDEIDRYLGWPGQAPSYKLGERLWLTARDEAKARAGDAFDLKAFHTSALSLGSMGLDVLRSQLAHI